MSFIADQRNGLEYWRTQNENTDPPPGYANPSLQDTVWDKYNKKALCEDKDLVDDVNNTVDVLLIFAGLFSGVVTAFISQTYPMVSSNQSGQSNQANLPNGANAADANSTSTASTKPPVYAVRVNCFLFASLFTSIFVALLSISVKQWTRSYVRDLSAISSSHLRARIRHFRYKGAVRWHLANIVGLLSIFMHFALFVSAVGICDLLLSTAPVVGWVACAVFGLGSAFFLVTSFLPLFVLDAPYRSPLSDLLMDIKEYILNLYYPRGSARSGSAGSGESNVGSNGSSGHGKEKKESKEGKEEGLEEPPDYPRSKESQENSVVRTQLHLDLDILSNLLEAADKSTERWILDLCFEKLPGLTILAKQNPSLILNRNIILGIYHPFARGCLTPSKHKDKHGKVIYELNPGRIQRARKLCEFLAWFLSLRRNDKDRIHISELLKKDNIDPMELPTILANRTHGGTAISAIAALGRLDHLFNVPKDTTDCTLCNSAATHLRERLTIQISDTAQGPQRFSNEDIIQEVTRLLVTRTDCLMFWNWAEELDWKADDHFTRDSNASNHLELLRNVIIISNPPNNHKIIWKKALNERKALAAPSLVSFWFDPLLESIDQSNERNTATIHSPTPTRANILAQSHSNGRGSPHSHAHAHAHSHAPYAHLLNNRNIHTPTPTRPSPAHNRVHALSHDESPSPAPFFPEQAMHSSPCPSPELAIRSPVSPALPTSSTSPTAQPDSPTPFILHGSRAKGARSDNVTDNRDGDEHVGIDSVFTFSPSSGGSGPGATITRPDSRNRSFSEGDVQALKYKRDHIERVER